MIEQLDIDALCGDRAANIKKTASARPRHMRSALQHFAAAGTPLRVVCDARHLNRKPSTVRRYCREFSIALSDWAPRATRPKKTPPAAKD